MVDLFVVTGINSSRNVSTLICKNKWQKLTHAYTHSRTVVNQTINGVKWNAFNPFQIECRTIKHSSRFRSISCWNVRWLRRCLVNFIMWLRLINFNEIWSRSHNIHTNKCHYEFCTIVTKPKIYSELLLVWHPMIPIWLSDLANLYYILRFNFRKWDTFPPHLNHN